MELYRLEVNPKEIGVEVDTLTRNNIRRSPHYQRLYNIMEEIAEYSIQNGLLLGKAINDIYTMHINRSKRYRMFVFFLRKRKLQIFQELSRNEIFTIMQS